MINKIRIVIADDHSMYVDGLELNLNATDEINVVATALNGKKLVELVNQYRPDVVVTDIRMPVMDGIEAIAAIQKTNKNIPILVLSTFDNNYLVVDALDAGALGYILKDASKIEIIDAIKTVLQGDPYYCSRTTRSLARLIKKSRFNPYPIVNNELFSPLEKQIIYYICEEKTSEAVAGLLHIGRRSIESYRSEILRKMNVKTSIGLAIYACKNKLYPVPDSLLFSR